MYTVKQVAGFASISVRTLHYYDEIGLLRPTKIGSNGYRYYDETALLRLQQILLYREMGMELTQIKRILTDKAFDPIKALLAHRTALREKIAQFERLLDTVEKTLSHLSGEIDMPRKQIFAALSPEQEREHTRMARLQYEGDIFNESMRRWGSYTNLQKEAIFEEGNEIYGEIADAIDAQKTPQSPEVQAIMVRWHNHIRYFYEPTLEILRGLGELYSTDPAFMSNFHKVHQQLPEYLRAAITEYVDALETKAIEEMLAADEAHSLQNGDASGQV
ncbi:MAG: MerR family transcriptional regulator [Anaerolineae bacterium]